MKKFFKYLGIGVGSVLVFLVIIIFIASGGTDNHDEIFYPYIELVLPELTKWEISAYEEHMSEKGRASATKEQWEMYLSKFSVLGTLQRAGEPELVKVTSMAGIGSGSTLHAIYVVPLEFDTGPAHVRLTLQHNDGVTKINGIRFLSDLLFQ